MAVNEEIVTGKKFRRLIDVATNKWRRYSFWNKAKDTECEDGTDVETKVGAIKGITTSTNVSETGYAADAKTVSELNQSLTKQVADIYVGEDGKLHKVQGGADSVLPFKSYNYDYYTGTSPFTKTFDRKPKSLVAICNTYATLVINGSIKYNQDNKININKNFSFYHNNCNGKEVYIVVFDYE